MSGAPRRTEAELAADLHTLLSQALHEDTKRGLCWKLIWDCTELGGRWKNPNFRWSRRAANTLLINKNAHRDWFKSLRREHSYPMSLSIGKLIVPGLSLAEVTKLLGRAAAVAVLHLEEARAVDGKLKSRLPDGADEWDLDARYRAVKDPIIEILPRTARPWEDVPDVAEKVDPDDLEPTPPEA